MLEPRRLLTFREVALRRSFSRAAEALSLTQPAVSQQVRALETQLGTRLIERRRGLFELTPTGELLLAHAEAVAERLRLAETQLTETRASERIRLRLGAFPSVLAGLVPAAVTRLRETTGDLELSVVEGSTTTLVEQIRDGRMHVAICFQDAAEKPRVHEATRRHDLFDEPMVVVVAPTHRLAGRKRVRLRELAREPWIAATPDGLIYRACVASGFEPRISYMTGDPLAIRALVAAGLAVSLTPRLLAPYLSGVATITVSGDAPPRRALYGLTPELAAHELALPFLEAFCAEAIDTGGLASTSTQLPRRPRGRAGR
jgi:DNA-binding transcriptional LysR family regulator